MTSPDLQPDFDALFAAMAPRVLSLGHRLTGDADLAQDVLQETFLAVYRSLSRFRAEAAVETWVYRIALNEARYQIKRARRRTRREASYGELHAADNCSAKVDERSQLEHAIASLPDPQREALTLLSLREIKGSVAAEILGIPEGTLYSRAFAARASLRTKLQADIADPVPQPIQTSPALTSLGESGMEHKSG